MDPDAAPTHPKNKKLYLPSALPTHLCLTGCITGLADKELRLRSGHADDTLNAVRQQL